MIRSGPVAALVLIQFVGLFVDCTEPWCMYKIGWAGEQVLVCTLSVRLEELGPVTSLLEESPPVVAVVVVDRKTAAHLQLQRFQVGFALSGRLPLRTHSAAVACAVVVAVAAVAEGVADPPSTEMMECLD